RFAPSTRGAAAGRVRPGFCAPGGSTPCAAPVAGHRRIRPPAGTAAPPTARRRGRRGAAMSVPRAEPGGSTPTPSPGPRRTHGRSLGGASPARASAAESLALVSSVASRSCRWGPSSARAPYRARLATDERSRSESAITIPGTGDHNAPESVIRIDRKERSRSAGTSDQDASEPASKRDSVRNCWLGGDLPDLDQSRPRVQDVQKAHIRKLLSLGIDGFRFDAAKHIDPAVVKDYIDLIDRESNGRTWNYLEVIEDDGTQATDYNWIAAVTDFVLYKESLRKAFGLGGDLRSLKVPVAVNDSRSIVFGRNHDTVPENNQNCIVGCYDRREDPYPATAYVLARVQRSPLVLNWDNYDAPYISTGVKFRQIMTQRGRSAMNAKENVPGRID